MRRPSSNPPIVRPAVCALVSCLMALSALVIPNSGVRAADSLTDAARQTAKPLDQQKVLRAEPGSGPGNGPAVVISIVPVGPSDCVPGGDPPMAPAPWEKSLFRNWRVGPIVVGSSLASGDFSPFALYGVQIGIEPAENIRLELSGLGGRASFAAGSDLEALLRNPREYGVGLAVRYVIGHGRTVPSIEPLAGFRIGRLSWRYVNGILLERDGRVEVVDQDGVACYAAFGGVGLTLMRTRHVELGWTLATGLRTYESLSDQGLRNDLFGCTPFTEMRVETRFAL